jgi:O-antigen ligase
MGVRSERTTSKGRGQWLEWTLVGLLGGNLTWTTLCLGGYRPETMLITSLLTALTLVVHLAARCRADIHHQFHPVGWLFLPFLLYAAANVYWITPVGWLGWHDWILWANLTVTFWVVLNDITQRRTRITLLACLGGLAFVATLLAAYQKFVQPDWLMLGRVQSDQFIGRSSGSFGIPNSLAAFYLLIIPAIWFLTFRRRATAVQRIIFGYLGLCCSFGLVLTVSRGGWLGLALALIVWPLWVRRGRWWTRVVRMVAVSVTIVGLGSILYVASPVVAGRLDAMAKESGEWTRPIMWRGAWQIFLEHRWFGSGGGSYNLLFEKYRPAIYQMEPQWAHNDYLNTLSDYGMIGFGLFFGVPLVMACLLRLRRFRPQDGKTVTADTNALTDPGFWQAIAVGLLAFALQLLVDFHFKIPALGMLFAVTAGLWVQQRWPAVPVGTNRTGWLSRSTKLTVALFVVTGAAYGLYPYYRAESLRYTSRQALDTLWRHDVGEAIYQSTLVEARAKLARACAINPHNAQAWADRAWATALWSHIEPARSADLGQEAAVYADAALSISKVVPEFWIRRAVAHDMQGDWLDSGADMVEAMLLAPASSWVWYYQAYHLSLQPAGKPQARAAIDYCLRLDPGNITAQRLRQQLATNQ